MLCCVCLLDNTTNIDIFEDEGRKLEVADIINKYLWFKVIEQQFFLLKYCSLFSTAYIAVCIINIKS